MILFTTEEFMKANGLEDASSLDGELLDAFLDAVVDARETGAITEETVEELVDKIVGLDDDYDESFNEDSDYERESGPGVYIEGSTGAVTINNYYVSGDFYAA